MILYQLALMGAPSDTQKSELERCLSTVIEPFGLHLGEEVALSICPTHFEPLERPRRLRHFSLAPAFRRRA
jgi:hypothetical protein